MAGFNYGTLAILAVFTAYVCTCASTLYGLFVPKAALPGEACYSNLLETLEKPLVLRVYVATTKTPPQRFRQQPIWEVNNFTYSRNEMNSFLEAVNVSIPEPVQAGKHTLYAHAVLTLSDTTGSSLGNAWRMVTTSPLTRRLEVPASRPKYRLLSQAPEPIPVGPSDGHPSLPETEKKLRTHWLPRLRVQIVQDFTCFPVTEVPTDVARNFQFFPRDKAYVPALTVDEFAIRSDEVSSLVLNSSTPQMSLQVSLGPQGLGWWRMFTHLQESVSQLGVMGADSKDSDDLRRMFTETSPVLLGVTLVVSLLHMLFETLAFKADVAFWRQRHTPQGLSLQAILFNTASQVVVLLYLTENESSVLVRGSVGVGLIIELWKVVRLWRMRSSASGFTESDTAAADHAAGKWALLLLSPCILTYVIYSLLYEDHTGWYGWIISSLYGLVLALGFVAMTPQLFINHRLKSVEHMPWRTLVYRALNTFIDDLFAFIITMPTMHRLSTFRDDIIFFIFLYQRWIYPTDPTRYAEGSTPEEKPADSKKFN